MKITIFGLTISSSWGNGHATPYRAILRALHRNGVSVTFYEKDVAYYAARRDFTSCSYCELVLYHDWQAVRQRTLQDARDSDIVITASYCPDGARINDEVLDLNGPLHVFYDLDTPVTLQGLTSGPLGYLRRDQIPAFDLYLSFVGGETLTRLERDYAARLARPLYGCVDPDIYRRVPATGKFACALSYMGTYGADRQQKLEDLFLACAKQRTDQRFVLAGPLYPDEWSWPPNVRRYEHIAPSEHPALYSSSRATLNVTRQVMADAGYCPSGRFFEAAACGTPILSDAWEGLHYFFDFDRELGVVRNLEDVHAWLDRPDTVLEAMGQRARERTLAQHTGEQRAKELLHYCEEALHARRRAVEVTA